MDKYKIGLARTIIFIRIYDMFSRNITILAIIYVGLARTIHIHGVSTVFLAGKSLNIRSYTVHIHGSGQPYIYGVPIQF